MKLDFIVKEIIGPSIINPKLIIEGRVIYDEHIRNLLKNYSHNALFEFSKLFAYDPTLVKYTVGYFYNPKFEISSLSEGKFIEDWDKFIKMELFL